MLQGKIEYRIQHYASHALYGNLLAADIKIYEYHKSYLHTKVAVVDKYWSTVGSSNIDPFSLLLAREANIIVTDHAFSLELRANLQQALQESNPVSARYWKTHLVRPIAKLDKLLHAKIFARNARVWAKSTRI